MNIPEELRYTADHEWVHLDGSLARVGITDFAQSALGDVVFVELPERGSQLSRGERLGEVESTKSVSEIYAPVPGTVVEVNDELASTPERLNSDPYGEGWICVIELAGAGDVDELLDAAGYEKLTATDE